MLSKTLIIGITGGIGSGKTEFSNGLRQMGMPVIDADIFAGELVEKNLEIQQKLKKKFGEAIFTKSGKLRRDVLGRKVFADQTELRKLNRIMQDPLNQLIKSRIQYFIDRESPKIIGIDMATLYEAGMDPICGRIIVIDAPTEKRYQWLNKSRNWSEKEIDDRIEMQWDASKKKKHADIIVENQGSIQELKDKAHVVFLNLLKEI